MYGQKRLQSTLTRLVEENNFPRFTILVGPKGSGKKLMAKYIGKELNANVVMSGILVDTVRAIVSNSSKWIGSKMLYVFPDADNMSPAAKNALLKVTEEPPRNAYFVLTLTDLNNTLSTIKSRASVFYMEPYTLDEINSYYTANYTQDMVEQEIIDDICSNPGEVNMLMAMNCAEFYTYVEKVVDNIAEVSDANSFKIADKIKFKESDDDSKYDLRLFFKAFMTICSGRLMQDPLRYASGITATSKYLHDLNITGINKQSTFDMWLLDIRERWL